MAAGGEALGMFLTPSVQRWGSKSFPLQLCMVGGIWRAEAMKLPSTLKEGEIIFAYIRLQRRQLSSFPGEWDPTNRDVLSELCAFAPVKMNPTISLICFSSERNVVLLPPQAGVLRHADIASLQCW